MQITGQMTMGIWKESMWSFIVRHFSSEAWWTPAAPRAGADYWRARGEGQRFIFHHTLHSGSSSWGYSASAHAPAAEEQAKQGAPQCPCPPSYRSWASCIPYCMGGRGGSERHTSPGPAMGCTALNPGEDPGWEMGSELPTRNSCWGARTMGLGQPVCRKPAPQLQQSCYSLIHYRAQGCPASMGWEEGAILVSLHSWHLG